MSRRLALCATCGDRGVVKVKRAVVREVTRRDTGITELRAGVETIADACPACAAVAEAECQAALCAPAGERRSEESVQGVLAG